MREQMKVLFNLFVKIKTNLVQKCKTVFLPIMLEWLPNVLETALMGKTVLVRQNCIFSLCCISEMVPSVLSMV